MIKQKLLFVVNDLDFFISHRLPIALAAIKHGLEVHLASPAGASVSTIRKHGIVHHPVPISRSGVNPLWELRSIWALIKVFRRLRPDIVHLVTIKPVLYGGLVARCLRVPAVVIAISGMGYLFADERRGPMRSMVERIYRLALGHPNSRVIVQNSYDRQTLHDIHALRDDQSIHVPGSGVDLDVYTATPIPQGEPIAMLPARMLREKGVEEFVQAARLHKTEGTQARFVLVGPCDEHNPGAISFDQLKAWHNEGVVEWWGGRDDMPQVYAQASLVVLPSYYREGMPKSLLEAVAVGRAIITTDIPGCRDVVEPDRTGELVPPRDVRALAASMRRLLGDHERLVAMGQRARDKAVAEFGVERVVETHLAVYDSLLEDPEPERA